MSSMGKARGASAMGVLLVLVGLVAGITLVLKLGPHYIDWRTMQSVFDNLTGVHEMSPADIRETLAKRFQINGLRDFDLRKVVEIDAKKDNTTLSVTYERREHIVGNVDVVLSFSESYQYP